jgi:hypothetical protein
MFSGIVPLLNRPIKGITRHVPTFSFAACLFVIFSWVTSRLHGGHLQESLTNLHDTPFFFAVLALLRRKDLTMVS